MINNDKTLDEIIEEIALEEGMTKEETYKLFKKGLAEANNKPKINSDKKIKNRKKNKQARKSRKKNR